MKQKILRILLILVVLIVLASAAGGVFFWRTWTRCSETEQVPEIILKAIPPEKGVPVARKFDFTVRLKTAWARKIAAVEPEPGKGSQSAGDPVIRMDSRAWGTIFWTVSIPVQAYVPGTIPAGRAFLVMEGGPEGTRRVEVTLPSFTSFPGNPEAELTLAGKTEIVPPRKKYGKYLIWGGAVLLLAGVLVWYFMYRRRQRTKVTVLPPWSLALLDIEDLRKDLAAGSLSPEGAVGMLTDVVRHYVEDRFQLRAERETTPEFLHELDRDNGPLAQEHRSFLRDFLSSADMVKFAKLPADRLLFDHAADKAEKLIRSTTPAAEHAGKEPVQ